MAELDLMNFRVESILIHTHLRSFRQYGVAGCIIEVQAVIGDEVYNDAVQCRNANF